MTRREKGPTCISNLADELQSHQIEAPNIGHYPLSTIGREIEWQQHLCLFGH